MISLGVESTADNLGIGIVSSDKKVMANYVKIHVPPKGGITQNTLFPPTPSNTYASVCDRHDGDT